MAKKQKKHTRLEKKLLEALLDLADNVEEDCPKEYRTHHLDAALGEAYGLIVKEG